MEVKLSNENFNKEVLNSEKPVLVDFWATWCGPCKMIAPIISEISEEFNNKVKVGKVNVDEEKELAIKYGISSMPTLVIFKDGKIAKTLIGFRPKEEIKEVLNNI